MRRWITVLSLLAALLAGCEEHHDAHKNAAHQPLYSPDGEPLNGGPLGQPACKDALSRWFDRVDANHDAAISLPEFLADADTQFHRMDIDNNGYIVSEELERFRRPYRQAVAEQTGEDNGAKTSGQPETKAGKHGRGGRHGGGERDSSPELPADVADPVMSADANMDFKVTPQEFMQHAREVFADMNTSHSGALTRDEVLARCP